MAGWIGYCLLISGLLALAAWASERALAHYRKPVRGVWAGAIVGSLVIPLVAFLFPVSTAQPVPVAPATILLEPAVVTDATPPAAVAASPLAWLESAGTLLSGLWVASVAGLGLFLARSYRRLRLEMRSWTPGEVLDSPVLLSPDRGPAVVGVRRAVIVLPRWVVQLEEDLLRLIFLHEREHQRVGDHKLFALGLAGVVLMPWNPMLWWSLRRLRLGMEFDCDRRVLARGVPRREYAEALLTVGSRISRSPLVATTFAEPRSAVETRLRRMTQPLSRLRGPRALAAASIAGLALGVACQSKAPVSPLAESPNPDVVGVPDAGPLTPGQVPGAQIVDLDGDGDFDVMVPSVKDESAQPTFIPYDTPPRLRNGSEVREALLDRYPRALRAAGTPGRVELWLYVAGTGAVENAQVKTSSGIPEFDTAALEAAVAMRFEPARHQDGVTAVWVSQWLTFSVLPEEAEGGRAGSEQASNNDSEGGLYADRITVRGSSEMRAEGPGVSIQGEQFTFEGSGDAAQERQPLFVIDGVVQDPSVPLRLYDLNQLDIEHLEVIRGEAAARLYGDAGRNGVVRITTKGSSGRRPASAGGAGHVPPLIAIEMDPSERVTGIHDETGGVVLREGVDGTRPVPLLVIDGVVQPAGFRLSDLKADEIAHVEITKGSAARAVYGERARNGVIHITTKSKN